MKDAELITEFVEHASEAAFRTLVERHLPLVSGTARRITRNPALAEEIAQVVFILLARRVRGFAAGVVLSGWLYRTTCFVSARALRSENRRQRREQEAVAMQPFDKTDPQWESIAPQLDDALSRLGDIDRNALVLRYLEDMPFSHVGSALGLGEEAAKKRVARALDKLRRIFERRGMNITAATLAAGLAHEATQAANIAGNVAKITAVALAPGATGSALLAEVLAAWHWAKVKMALAIGVGMIATASLIWPALKTDRLTPGSETNSSVANRNSFQDLRQSTPGSSSKTMPASIDPNVETALLPLQITVLDAFTGEPVPGANVSCSLQLDRDGHHPETFLTDSNGIATLAIPPRSLLPREIEERMSQFQIWISAQDYAPREIMWLSSTGSVMNLVTNDYTVRIESGVTLTGTVVDDEGQPLANVRVGASGSNYRGYSYSYDSTGKITTSPVLRVEDFAEFSVSSEQLDARLTDRDGQFQIRHFPSDLKAVVIDLIGPDGARRKFRTPQGERLSSEEMAQVPFDDLLTGAARLVLPRGITVEGIVVDANGQPVIGATVSEGVQWGNLKILSRNETDMTGRFWLSNRPPREIILAASTAGYASASVIASIKPGMQPVRIQLTSEQPLRGRVVNDAGEALGGVNVTLMDLHNEGLGLEWAGKTDGDGRFVWQAAPTNQVGLMFAAMNYAARLVYLAPSTNEHVITLHPGSNESLRVSGTVSDADTGKPIEQFTTKICHGTSLQGAVQTISDNHGHFELKTSQSEVAVGEYAFWTLQIEADGYETVTTRNYDYLEGDQQFNLQLRPGGTINGIVRTPDGEPAAECQLTAVAARDHVYSYHAGDFSSGSSGKTKRADNQGRFKLTKASDDAMLIASHDAGWAACPTSRNTRHLDVQLLPWATIEGDLLSGQTPVAGENILVTELIGDPANPVTICRDATTDDKGHFVFEMLPAGEYQVSLASSAWQRMGQESVKALQTPAKPSAGERFYVRLGETGSTVTVKLRLPPSATALDWNNAQAILNRNVTMPPRPSRNDFVNEDSHRQAAMRYPHDPAVLAAMRRMRSYVGQVASDGTVTFTDIPADSYVLEVKLFAQSNKSPAGNSARFELMGALCVPVTVPAKAKNSTQAVTLGNFALESR